MSVEPSAPAIRPARANLDGALLVVGTLVLAAGALLQAVGAVTGAMTVTGCPSGSPVILQVGGSDADERARTVTGWHAWERAAEGATAAADAPACASVARPTGERTGHPTIGAPEGRAGAPSALAAAQRWFDVDIAFALGYGAWLTLALAWFRRQAPAGRSPTQALGSPLRQLTRGFARGRFAPMLPIGAALADVVENVVLRRQLSSWWATLDREGLLTAPDVSTAATTAAAWAGILKWGLVAVALLIVAIGVAPVVWGALRTVARSVPSMWLPMLAAVAFAVALAGPDQAADALRRLSSWQWLTTLGVLGVFTVTLATTAAGSLRPTASEGDRPGPPPPPRAAVAGDGVLLGAAALLAVIATTTGRHGLVVPAVLIGLVATASLALDVARSARADADTLFDPVAGPPAPTGPDPDQRCRVAAGVAVLPLLTLGFATIGSSAADTVLGVAPDLGAARRVVLGCLLVVAAAPAFVAVRQGLAAFAASATLTRRAGLLGALVALHLPFAAMHVPGVALGHAHRFGSVALAMVFVSGFVLIPAVAATASYHAVRTSGLRLVALPTVLRLVGFRSTPVLGLLVAWGLLAGTVGSPGYHDVRRLDGPHASATVGVAPPPDLPWSVGAVALNWLQRQSGGGPSPALVVAASGGGIRAAFYTAAALDCVIERDGPPDDPCGRPADAATVAARRRSVLTMSGISGGSLGITAYVVAVEAAGGWPAEGEIGNEPGDGTGRRGPSTPLEPGWHRDRLGDDYLAPTIATWLFNDGLNALLRPRTGVDRAAILERAWERSWTDGELGLPFFAGQTTGRQPVLLLNGFDVDDGCRVNTSVVASAVTPDGAAEPVGASACRAVPPAGAGHGHRRLLATSDAVAQLCADDDLRYSTAALNSARFPFVSPAGRLAPCARDTGADGRPVTVVDGGYRETSGSSTVAELWPALAVALDEGIAAEPGGPTCVQPVFLQIDNGPEAAVTQRRSDRGVAQWLAPAVALGASPGGQEAAARQASRSLFGDGWFRIATFAHPGSSAPLGWVLSETAQADLERQVVLNADTIVAVRARLDDPAPC